MKPEELEKSARTTTAKLAEIVSGLATGEDVPYHLSFYTCRKDGRLRIFNICDVIPGFATVAEALVGDMQPIATLFTPMLDCGLYRHVNYGGMAIGMDGARLMQAFAARHGLTDLERLGEVHSLRETGKFMLRVVAMLSTASSVS